MQRNIKKRKSLHPHRPRQKREKTLHVYQTNPSRIGSQVRLNTPRNINQVRAITHRGPLQVHAEDRKDSLIV